MRINIDAESVKEFRNKLLALVEELQTQLKKTEVTIDEVSQSWQDLQFQKFKEGFESDKEMLTPLCKEIEAFESEVLYPMEQTVREYSGL